VGVVGEGAYEVAADGSRKPIHVSDRASLRDASLVVSRSRTSASLAAAVQAMGAGPPTAHGSSGLKAALVATGAHDAYVQSGPAGMRWDACSSEALVLAAGGMFTDCDGSPVDYRAPSLVNDRGLLATNGRIHAAILDALRR
jgi:3'-phosphoadenosine 5'-phosphosulfate (PAPS) 3'-phosphatase